MTAAALIAAVDALRPNQYTNAQKLGWLRRLDGQIKVELLDSHTGDSVELPDGDYTDESELLAVFPYAEELYTAYLFAQIDLNNAEIQKYDQSAALLSSAWRQYADWYNRSAMPLSAGAFRM